MADREERPAADPRGPDPPRSGRGGGPFQRLPGARARLVDRVLRRPPAGQAFIELNNLLAGVRDPREVSDGDVARICRRYGFDVTVAFGARCQQLYRDYLRWCLTDRRLSEEEIDTLAHLARLLRIDPASAEAILHATTRSLYLRSVEDVLADGAVSEAERAFLRRLSGDLGIPAGTADNMLEMRRRQLESRKPRDD